MKRKFILGKYRILALITLLLGCGATVYWLLFRLGYLMPPQQFASVACLCCQSDKAVHTPLENDRLLAYEQPLASLIDQQEPNDKISILIEKSKYRLTIYQNLQPVKSYPVVFGGNPQGDKLREGDRQTPEGVYLIRDLYPHSSWSKFIWLDYPNTQSWREHFQAKLNGELNWFFPVGSEIGIHGVPQGADSLIDRQEN